jgi:hypothetical protein
MRGKPSFVKLSTLAPLLIVQKVCLLLFSEFLQRFHFLIGPDQRFTAAGQLLGDDFSVTVHQPNFTEHVSGVITSCRRAVDVDISSRAELPKFVNLADPSSLQQLTVLFQLLKVSENLCQELPTQVPPVLAIPQQRFQLKHKV